MSPVFMYLYVRELRRKFWLVANSIINPLGVQRANNVERKFRFQLYIYNVVFKQNSIVVFISSVFCMYQIVDISSVQFITYTIIICGVSVFILSGLLWIKLVIFGCLLAATKRKMAKNLYQIYNSRLQIENMVYLEVFVMVQKRAEYSKRKSYSKTHWMWNVPLAQLRQSYCIQYTNSHSHKQTFG